MKQYPREYFPNVDNINITEWSNEGYNRAIKDIYSYFA